MNESCLVVDGRDNASPAQVGCCVRNSSQGRSNLNECEGSPSSTIASLSFVETCVLELENYVKDQYCEIIIIGKK